MARVRRYIRRMLIVCVILALIVLLDRAAAACVCRLESTRSGIYRKNRPPAPGSDHFRRRYPCGWHAQRDAGGSSPSWGGIVFRRKSPSAADDRGYSTRNHNEPAAMRRYALALGVPDSAIVLDYAGFRTYDSCYRAREIFQVDSAILVTQDFHLDRALLICNQLGVDSVGVVATRSTGYARRSLHVQPDPRVSCYRDGAGGSDHRA